MARQFSKEAIALVVVLVLFFSFLVFRGNEQLSVTGHLASVPTGANAFDAVIENTTATLQGQEVQFTGIKFVATGGSFVINAVVVPTVQVSQFHLVLIPLNAGAVPFIGMMLYQSPSSVWQNGGISGGQASASKIDFKHFVKYNTNNKTKARPQQVTMNLSGSTFNLTQVYSTSGSILLDDSIAAWKQQGKWNIAFKYNYLNSTGFGAMLNGSRVASYFLDNTLGGVKYSTVLNVPRGFQSPAFVNLTDFNELELRFLEKYNGASSAFRFICTDQDAGSLTSSGKTSLVYSGGYAQQLSSTLSPIGVIVDKCFYQAQVNSVTNYLTGNLNAEATCTLDGLPTYLITKCPGSCNAGATACAS